MASAISATGEGGGLALSPAISAATRAVISRQSSTQARTSASTRSIAATISARLRLVVDALDMNVDEALAQRPGRRGPEPLEGGQTAGVVTLDGKDGMHDEADVDAEVGELGEDRIDQKRHVVIDDLEHRIGCRRARPPVTGAGASKAIFAVPGLRISRNDQASAAKPAR